MQVLADLVGQFHGVNQRNRNVLREDCGIAAGFGMIVPGPLSARYFHSTLLQQTLQ